MTSKSVTTKSAIPCFLLPDWPAPDGVHALITTRQGGVSIPPFGCFNLALHVGDDPRKVSVNRATLRRLLPSEPVWLQQVHGVHVIDADAMRGKAALVEADASVARTSGTVCVVMTADCLPVLFSSRDGRVVAAAHAGWRGLCSGVLEETIKSMTIKSMNISPDQLIAYLGPAIGPTHFEVGPEVREAFVSLDAATEQAFRPGQGDRWMADIFWLARRRLRLAGLAESAIFGGGECTVSYPERFYSYRRDKQTGRMAALIWRD